MKQRKNGLRPLYLSYDNYHLAQFRLTVIFKINKCFFFLTRFVYHLCILDLTFIYWFQNVYVFIII